MRLRPLSLLLAPFWLLAAIALLAACEVPATGPTAGPGSDAGVATALVITVVPDGTPVTGVALTATPSPMTSPEPATPLPTLASASLTPSQLKYRILDQYPDFFFCDPDYYPIARADEAELARERFPELQTNQEEFQAILVHNGLSGVTTFTDGQKLLIYREHKKLAALQLQMVADQYQFQLITGRQPSMNVRGIIDDSGRIMVEQQTPGFATCPICLAAHTRIDTPEGTVFVEGIKVGDTVWTLDSHNQRFQAPVLKVARVPVSAGHVLLHIRLADGRELWASPGHPTADGRRLMELQVGDLLDKARVVAVEEVPYNGGATYDLLPAGPTGFYWADGMLMGSTLKP